MFPDEKIGCHLTGFKMSCFEGVSKHKCQKWANLRGTHPQTGAPVDFWGCTDALSYLVSADFGKQLNELGAAVESLRNENTRIANQQSIQMAEILAEKVSSYILPAAQPLKVIEDGKED